MKPEMHASTQTAKVPLPFQGRRIEPQVLLGSATKMSAPPILFSDRWPVFNVEIRKSGLSSNDPTVPHPAKDHLLSVHQIGDTFVVLRFLDGLAREFNLADLGLDLSRLRIGTIIASEWGGAAEIQDQSWNTIHIDSSVLRALVDPQYAAVLREAISELR